MSCAGNVYVFLHVHCHRWRRLRTANGPLEPPPCAPVHRFRRDRRGGTRARCRVRHRQSEFCLAQDPEIVSARGLDMSPAYVSTPTAAMTTLAWTSSGNACTLPFPDASFDHAVSMLALQFVPQADLAVREMRRVTRVGGIVAAATWDTRGGFVALRMIFDAAAVLDQSGREGQSGGVHQAHKSPWGSGARVAGRRPRGCRAGHAHNPHGLCIVCGFLGSLRRQGGASCRVRRQPPRRMLGRGFATWSDWRIWMAKVMDLDPMLPLPGSLRAERPNGKRQLLARNCRLSRCSHFFRNRGINRRSAGVAARTVRDP